MALLTLVGFGCQSAEERQAQELRQALRQIVDEIEELRREEIELLRQRKEVVDATPSFKTQWGYETMASSRVYAKQGLESAEQRLPKMLSELRQEVEEYTDAELPMLAMAVRGRKTGAERAVEEAKKGLAQAKREKEEAEVAAKERAAAAKPIKPKPQNTAARARPAPPKKPAPPTPPPPTKTPEEIRAELSKRIEEVDGIHEKVISTLQAVQEAQTDKWQKRWAGDAVTSARIARKQDSNRLRLRLERAKDGGLGLVEQSIASVKRQAEGQLAQAQGKLKAAEAAATQ
ncbi:MAG: hypothetical protein OXU64_02985 [Gemmatimonadota bacterium]|nr:hypothetical protein [Deltaproteobacteria bacterium]MDE2973678.1 hypothetical protein [Gemmatimonadota bacterium]